MRPVYLCPGTIRDRCVLYASSRLVGQQAAAGRLTFTSPGFRACSIVAIRADGAAGGRRVDGPQNAAGHRTSDRRTTIEDFRESWCYDSRARLLLIAYQDSGAGGEEHVGSPSVGKQREGNCRFGRGHRASWSASPTKIDVECWLVGLVSLGPPYNYYNYAKKEILVRTDPLSFSVGWRRLPLHAPCRARPPRTTSASVMPRR